MPAPVLSKGKPAFQSSISNPFGSPERAVDGSLLSDFDEGNCIQTNKEINPWWMVDLGSTETVKSVAITPRKDCCTEELYGAFILVGELPENGGIFNSKCAVIGSLSRGKTEFFRCGTMRGRYVSVISPKREIFLSFCEVRVFGKTSDFISHDDLPITPPVTSLPKANDDTVLTGPLLSEQRPTSQSSASLPSQSPQKPMDGSIQSGYCVQTLQENDPWWMIDLGSTQTLGFVSITNRKDCCPEQIKGTLILVGDTPHHGGKWNARCAIIPSLGLGIKQIFSCGEMNGRYVTITKPGREKVLSFCDVKVFGKAQNSDKNGLSSTLSSTSADNQQINNHFNSYYNFDLTQNNFAPVLSEGKPAFQSSIFSFSGSPERAVDGSLFSDFEKGTCIQTDRKINPWWMVDLGSTEIVQSVALTPRNDCCTEELRGALILVGDSHDEGGMPNNRCAIIGSLAHGKTEFFRCGMMRGRYVSVVNPKREETFLSFCEVRVFGKASESISPSLPTPSPESQLSTPNASNASDLIGPLLSKQRPTSQSSVFIPSPFLQKPMDGSIQSNYCVQTLQENDPWWMIDLGSTQTLGFVSITNRKDCCPELIKGTLILVGDSPDQGGKWNDRCAIIPSLGLGIKELFNCGEMNGRYVTITKPGREKVLSFCDLKVFGKSSNSKNNVFHDSSSTLSPTSGDDQHITDHGSYYNFDLTENNFAPVLSKGKPTFQSSISNPFGSPERAVDGSLLSDFDEGNCIQTNKDINPWWMVDLGSTETVKSVAITPRKDCCTEELYGAFILVGELPENGGIFNSKCAVIGSLSRGKTEFFRCGTMRGRYVSVISPKREIFLSFCEVRVFGKTSDFISHDDLPVIPPVTSLPKANDDTVLTGPLLSEQRPTSQSSASLPSQSPQKPMDGSIQSGYCVQTLQENDPWWMIDLGSTQTLGFVSITNRKDCCPEQIKGTLILVGDSSHHGGKWNARCAVIPSLGAGTKQVFSCGEMNGRYVTIIKPGREKILSFCDLKVFGKAWNSNTNVFHYFPSTLSPTSGDDQQ
uniref:Fucolectin tachylectin-4 pentraxin-1 domain-containing protein n=1 Tax=Sarcophilus harrisii TaxID=9305 RepID=A0A7N4P6A0_SARHA